MQQRFARRLNARVRWVLVVYMTLLAKPAFCQSTTSSSSSSSVNTGTRATQLPLSGRSQQTQSGSVSVQQSTQPGSSSSTSNTINTQINIQGNYTGSISNENAVHAAITLTLDEAIRQGLRFNLGSLTSSNSLRQARGQRLLALSALLPSFNASLSETGAKQSLLAIGLTPSTLPIPGLSFPSTVGPFHYYDLQANASYDVLDLVALHNYRGAKESERASKLSDQDARELVVLAVGGTYLRVLATSALVTSQEAQVEYARSSYNQAQAQSRAGTRSDVDLRRSLVQLQTEQQRLTSERADLLKQKRSLVRTIGLALDVEVLLREQLPFTPQVSLPLDDALRAGFAQRNDLRAAEAQLKAALESVRAAHAERLPFASLNGFFGAEGTNPNAGNGVYSATGSITVPIWQGGRIRSDEIQADATANQRRAEYQDQRNSVELDIRNAYTDLQVATDQVRLAISNRELALQTLKQSQDRYAAGVADSVEVVQSEQSLASAESDYISALYSHNLGKISLARAMGEAEKKVPALLKGP